MFSGASGDGVKSEGRRLKASGLEEERLKKGKTCRGCDNESRLYIKHMLADTVFKLCSTQINDLARDFHIATQV